MGRKKNNKGFSLVELLAAIVIMGILSGIAVVGVTFLLNKAGREYYKAQESEVIMAAKSYTQDNRSFLPKRVGQKNQIYLKTLQDKKYIGDVLDRNKKKCDPDRSYVQVYRYNKNNYSYVVNLVCDKYTSEGRNPTNLVGPDIKFVFSGIGANDNYDLAKVTVTIEDEDKISGYRYIISKSGNEIKNSGDIDGKLEKKVTFTIPLKEFVPGTVEVKVIATDFYGNESTKKETKTIKNSKAPTCTPIKINTEWTNKPPVEVQVKCIDYTGLGCKKDVYTQLFYTEAKIGLVEMEDNAGNKGECSANTYIDLTPPSTPVIKNTYENKWINKSYTVQVTSVDSTSGIAYFEYRYPNSDGKDGSGNPENEWHRYKNSSKEPGDNTPFVTTAFSKERDEYVEIRACDRAGNCSESGRSMIKIDKTRPTCTITRNKANPDGLNGWYVTNVTLSLSTTNPKGTSDRAVASGISYDLKNKNSASYNGITTNIQKETKGITWYGFIKDEAGNTNTCNSGEFKVDTTKPLISNVSNPYNNKWCGIKDADASKYKVKLTSSDSTSGLDYHQYRYPNSTVDGERDWKTYDSSSNSPFDTTAFVKQRNEIVEFRVCDKAGLCSDIVNTKIQIDKENPTCVSSGGQSTWKQSITLVGTCSDTGGSGCKDNISKTITTEGTFTGKGPGTVYDNAGNSVVCPTNQSYKIDRTKPTCILQATTSGVSFKTKSDNNVLASYGMSNSASSSYNSTSSMGLAVQTYYGFVKDEAGNENTCKATLTSTYASKYTKVTRTCNRSFSSVDCRKSANINYYCPSGYNDNGSRCYYTTNATASTTWTKTSMYCKATSSTSYGTVYRCSGRSKRNCTGKCKWMSKGGNSSCVGNPWNEYCDSGYTYSGGKCVKTSTSYSWTNRSTSTVSSCSDNIFNCISGNGGRTYVACTNKNTTYSCSSGSRNGTKCYHYADYSSYYSCNSGGSLSGSYCYKVGMSSCPSGFSSYNTNYNYYFNDNSNTNATTCSVQSSFSCGSSKYNSSYVSSCTPTQWSCSSGTKLNDNFCYKIG